jgi:hypothetical protein
MRTLLSVLLSSLLFMSPQQSATQAPSASPSQSPSPGADATQKKDSSSSSKKKSLPVLLIVGTVFNEKALSFPGVRVRIRQSGEKKFRWDVYTNSRGEFAVRVPEGQEYEVLVQAKNFKDQSRKVSTKIGDVQERLSIKLEPVTQDNTGARE